jgi:NAD(P)-dependent dehydrogenase (short-subunit alcohol dehydrogenase family)
MATVLITGANRGIGFELARQYAADGWRVLATCRRPEAAGALRALGPLVEIHSLDVTDHDAVTALARTLAAETIDVLIANAGIYIARDMTTAKIDAEGWRRSFEVNTIAPFVCAGAFLPHVARSRERKIVALSTLMASIGAINGGSEYAYRSSKAALNMIWRALAIDHPEVIALLVAPGQVRTDMNPEGHLAPAESIAGLRRLIAAAAQKDSGRFFRYDGAPAPF